MNRIDFNFKMARFYGHDIILKELAEEALTALFESIEPKRIKGILLTGSIVDGEGTIVKHDSSMIASDFDFIIYLSPLDFFIYRRLIRSLSHDLSVELMKRGINSHVEFLPSTYILHGHNSLVRSNIYEYEFAFGSKCLFGKTPSFDKTVRPTKVDALELTFKVISDLVFSKCRPLKRIEESYIYAKRALTILNSLLIFHGIFAKTYKRRMKIAEECALKGILPISRDELKMLQVFTEFKLSGSFEDLIKSLSYKKEDDVIKFQRNFLKVWTMNTLYHELVNLTNPIKTIDPADKKSPEREISKFPELLRNYIRHSKVRLLPRVIGGILYFLFFLSRDKQRKEMFATFVFHKQSPKAILNVLITLIFIHGSSKSVARIFKGAFPWVYASDDSVTQKIFDLWQYAEQSVKLN